MDYEALLKKYIHHVRTFEGTDFVSDADAPLFTAEEIVALNRLGDEVDAEWKRAGY